MIQVEEKGERKVQSSFKPLIWHQVLKNSFLGSRSDMPCIYICFSLDTIYINWSLRLLLSAVGLQLNHLSFHQQFIIKLIIQYMKGEGLSKKRQTSLYTNHPSIKDKQRISTNVNPFSVRPPPSI